MDYRIQGSIMPALEITLQKGQAVFSEKTGMAWMHDTIDMGTGLRGGLGGIINRMFAGESLFLTTFRAEQDGAKVVFTPGAPGAIIPVRLEEGQSVIAQRDSFMCAEDSVKIGIHLKRRLGAGLFGGEGFILQKLTGPGMAFIEVGGEVVEYTLAEGEKLLVNPGYLAMHEPTVDYDIRFMRGIRNLFFGGEGLFLASLKGPGRVWLQTMPIANLAASILTYMPQPELEAKANEQEREQAEEEAKREQR